MGSTPTRVSVVEADIVLHLPVEQVTEGASPSDHQFVLRGYKMKTRNDFYLEEDYDAYKSMHELNTYLLSILDGKTMIKVKKMTEAVESKAYSSGYSNARYDQEERS